MNDCNEQLCACKIFMCIISNSCEVNSLCYVEMTDVGGTAISAGGAP